jgi:hypothetical protein
MKKTPPYEIKVCPKCGRQTDRWCYEHGLDMIAGERIEVVPADAYRGAVDLLRELSEKWTDVRVSGNAARVAALGDAVRRARELTGDEGQS